MLIINEKFIQKVLEKFTKQITDQVFLMIQNDRDLYIEYCNQCHSQDKNKLNRDLEKAVKEYFDLVNLNEAKLEEVKSVLITSYTKHKK